MHPIIFVIPAALILATIILFEPKLDMTPQKKLLLWYNSNHSRKYIKIW